MSLVILTFGTSSFESLVNLFLEPQRAASSVVPTVRIDPDGMPDMTDGRRTFPEREQDRKSKGSSVVKDQSKEKPKAKPQVDIYYYKYY